MKEQIAAIAVAAVSNDTASLQACTAQGVSLANVGYAAVEPVVEAVREGRVEEAKVMWSALSELGADFAQAGPTAVGPVVEAVVNAVREGKMKEAKVMWSALNEMGVDMAKGMAKAITRTTDSQKNKKKQKRGEIGFKIRFLRRFS